MKVLCQKYCRQILIVLGKWICIALIRRVGPEGLLCLEGLLCPEGLIYPEGCSVSDLLCHLLLTAPPPSSSLGALAWSGQGQRCHRE